MPLAMNREVFITCAVTGSGGTQDKSPHVPRSPEQIATSAIDAAILAEIDRGFEVALAAADPTPDKLFVGAAYCLYADPQMIGKVAMGRQPVA